MGSILQGHPDMRKTPGIDMTAGSLGHGLSAGLGMALSAKAKMIEKAGKAGDVDSVKQGLPDLESAYKALQKAIDAKLFS